MKCVINKDLVHVKNLETQSVVICNDKIPICHQMEDNEKDYGEIMKIFSFFEIVKDRKYDICSISTFLSPISYVFGHSNVIDSRYHVISSPARIEIHRSHII